MLSIVHDRTQQYYYYYCERREASHTSYLLQIVRRNLLQASLALLVQIKRNDHRLNANAEPVCLNYLFIDDDYD